MRVQRFSLCSSLYRLPSNLAIFSWTPTRLRRNFCRCRMKSPKADTLRCQRSSAEYYTNSQRSTADPKFAKISREGIPVMSDQPQVDEIRCSQCRHASGVYVDRSFTDVLCGNPDCPKFKTWTLAHASSGDCPCYAPHTPSTQRRYETAWELSADRLDAFWSARRFPDRPYDGPLALIPHADELYDSDPPIRPAPVLLDEILKNE